MAGNFDVDKIGINDHFFELGGHSLKATTLIAKIYREFEVELPLREVFQNPTIKELAQRIKQAESSKFFSIQPMAEAEYYPVSSAQKRLYLLNMIEGENTSYNIPGAVMIEGNLDPEKIARVFKTLVKRHESFRTSFFMVNGEPAQKIHSEAEFELALFKCEAEKVAEKLVNFVKAFDLSQAPLLRAGLIELSPKRWILIYDMHHIISDGVSRSILINEFANLYNGRELPGLRIQYRDFAIWHNTLLQSEAMRKQEEYWLKMFGGEIPVLELPADYPRSNVKWHEAGELELEIGETITQKLNEFSAGNGATLYITLLTAYNILLWRATGQEDLIVGTPTAGRCHPDLENLVGMFVNTVLLRNYPHWEKTFLEFFREVRENTIKAFENQDYQFEMLLDKLNLKRDLSRNPLFSTIFNFLNFYDERENLVITQGDFKISPYRLENKTTISDLTVQLFDWQGKIKIRFLYRTGLFKKSTIEYLLVEYARLLEEIAQNPVLKLGEFQILRKKNPRIKGNQVCDNVPFVEFKKESLHRSISERFEEMVRQYRDQTAVKAGENVLTYSLLNKYANRVAHSIIRQYDDRGKLSKPEKIRYSRQLLLWGVEGQEKIKKTTVFVAGAGGSGSPLIYQLALCGIGNIIVCDYDTIELSNLNRQFLHDESRIGVNKAVSAKMTIERINPNVNLIPRPERITRDNIYELVGDATFILDNVDDMETKFILSECAVAKGIPHIISSMIDISSYAAIFHTPMTPCFHCLYNRNKLKEVEEIKQFVRNYQKMPNPVASPSLFLSTGFVCNEIIKIILGNENPAYNKYFLFNQKGSKEIVNRDGYKIITYPFSNHFRKISREHGFDWDEGWRGNFLEEIPISPDPDCPLCGEKNREKPNQSIPKIDQTDEKITLISNGEAEHPNQTVALLFEHGADMIIGMIGALKAGKIYVPWIRPTLRKGFV